MFGRRSENFAVLVFKNVWTTLQKRSKSMIFAKEIVFSKRIISKFSRLRRGYTPRNYSKRYDVVRKAIIHKCKYSKSNYSNIVHAAALAKQFSNLHAAIALSTHAQNVFTVWLAR